MRLSAKALAITSALLWGGRLTPVRPHQPCGALVRGRFLRGMGSVYPGFYHSRTFRRCAAGHSLRSR